MDKIAVDAMGGDFAPLEIVLGAIEAVREYHIPVCWWAMKSGFVIF